MKLDEVLQKLSPLHEPLDQPGGSVLLKELANVVSPSDATLSPQATPLLHALSSCHAYIMMFVHVCRMGQVSKQVVNVYLTSASISIGEKNVIVERIFFFFFRLI
jgi:E3 ubiquitin-protein ligase HUWE1